MNNPDQTVKKALADEVRKACMNVGFLYGMLVARRRLLDNPSHTCHVVKNHGIPEETTENALAASKNFFSLPDEKKMEVPLCSVSSLRHRL